MCTKVKTIVANFPLSAQVKVVMRDTPVKERKLYGFTGMATRVMFGACNNSAANLLRALNERVYNTVQDGVLRPTIQPKPGVIAERLTAFSDRLSKFATVLLPLSYSQFCERYTGRRKVVYENAVRSLQVSGVCKKDAMVKSFIKFEKGNITEKPDACPRLISPRDPRYNVEIGRFIAHGEKAMFKAIGRVFGHTTVFKGMNAIKSAEKLRTYWLLFHDPIAVGVDAKRYDQHYSVPMLRWEHDQWKKFIPRSEWTQFMRLVEWQLENIGLAYVDDAVISYVTSGGRMSGDMNTSSGNCLSMCAMIYAYMAHCGIDHYRLANNGDDCIIIMERCSYAAFANGLDSWFEDMGFSMAVEEPVDVFEKIVFCQTQPVWNGENWVMVRDPHAAIAKDTTANCDISSEGVFNRWCDCMHEGGRALTAGIPVWEQFYGMFPTLGKRKAVHIQTVGGLVESGMWRLRGGLEYRQLPVGPDQRVSFWKAFGVLPDDQITLEKQYAQIQFHYAKPTRTLWMESVSVLDAHNPKLLGNIYGGYFSI